MTIAEDFLMPRSKATPTIRTMQEAPGLLIAEHFELATDV
jgi:hypothetical protein